MPLLTARKKLKSADPAPQIVRLREPQRTAASMRTDLLPLSVGDIFDEAFDLYKRHFALFTGTIALVHVPIQLAIGVWIQSSGIRRQLEAYNPRSNSEDTFAIFGTLLLLMLVYLFTFLLQSSALTLAVSDRYLGYPLERTTIFTVWRRVLPHLLRLCITWAIVGLLVFVGGLLILSGSSVGVGILATVSGPGAGSPALAVAIGLAVSLVPLTLMLALLCHLGIFSTQIVLLEGTAYSSAVSRNGRLIQGRFLRVLSTVLLITLFYLGMWISLHAFIKFILNYGVYSWMPVSSVTDGIISSVWSGLIWIVLQPFWMTALTILYYDHRVRKEGFDIALMEHHLRRLTAEREQADR